MQTDKISSKGFAAELKAARKGASFLPLNKLPEEAEFGKISKYILHHKPSNRVIFCPGVSHTVCSSIFSGAWAYSDSKKCKRKYVYDSHFDGNHWLSLKHVLGIKLSLYEQQLEDVELKGIQSPWVTKPCINIRGQKVGVLYLQMDHRGSVKRASVGRTIRKQTEVENLSVKARKEYVRKCILFLRKTIQALDNPTVLLTNYDDWMKGSPII